MDYHSEKKIRVRIPLPNKTERIHSPKNKYKRKKFRMEDYDEEDIQTFKRRKEKRRWKNN